MSAIAVRSGRLWALAMLLLCSGWLWAAGLAPIPALTQPVEDTAQMMQPQARAELNRHLLDYAREHGSQIVVLTVDSIAPETPFDYATRVMDVWKPGRSGMDDGVLLLLVKNERQTHLAVGRGLEGAIPDVYAKRILDDVLRPYLRQGQTDAGIQAAVLQVEKLIAGEALPAAKSAQQDAGDMGLLPLLIAVFFGGGLLKNLFGRTLGSIATGGLVLAAGWLLGWFWLFTAFLAFSATVFTFVAGAFSFVGGGGSGSGRSGGGWGSSGGFGGGFGGGGGFSGGGGGFGGGGASGGW